VPTNVIYGLNNLPELKACSSCTIGVFDGVHKGHQKIIRKTIDLAKKNGCSSVVITFDPHPSAVINPDYHPTILTGINLKIDLILGLGVDYIIVIDFDKDFADITPNQFLEKILHQKLKVKAIVEGEGFRFGKDAMGDVELLEWFCKQNDIELSIVPLCYTADGLKISSTRIRHLLKEGAIQQTKEILGHYPMIMGKVVKGGGRGGLTGFHTANIETSQKSSVPKEGVYAGNIIIDNKKKPAVINIGPAPTFGVKKHSIEAHILNFKGDLYHQEVELEVRQRIRDIKEFSTPAKLTKQIKKDIKKV